MKEKLGNLLSNFRIIFSIVRKDILQGWKNKVILSSMITSLFLVIFYNYMPELTRGNDLPLLVILDPEETIQPEKIESITNFKVSYVNEMDAFLYKLRDIETPGIGIKAEKYPSGPQNEKPVVLQGYFPYWMKMSKVEELKSSAELILADLWNGPVEISTQGNIIYPVMDNYAYGKTFIATAGLLLQITVMGLSLAPQLVVEEKESRTLQAIMISPANLNHFILGKGIAVLFYTILTTVIGLIFVGPLVLNWGLTLLALLIGMLTIITPGILLGVLFQTKQQISIWIWVLFIPTILPLFLSIIRVLPDGFMKVIDWWPTVVLSRLLRAGFTDQPPINAYALESGYLLLLAVTFFGLTVWAIHQQTLRGR